MFITDPMLTNLHRNIQNDPWSAKAAQKMIDAAAPWLALSDEELWGFMFGATLPRSWTVYPNGFCPACKAPFGNYGWKFDAWKHPWKAVCPHCEEQFPKNDFGAFYESGLDEHNVFDPQRADRNLLFNTEHPDPNDPRHFFGVDDGNGYRVDNHCWYFIASYLIGQWNQKTLAGISALAAAYVLTQNPQYAHKAGVLLDRVADLYPTFDFRTQARTPAGTQPPGSGYISVWHGACEDCRSMTFAYDAIRPALATDKSLVDFLSQRAKRYKLSNPKSKWSDIQHNIEDRILRDSLRNAVKIESNYPRGVICRTTIHAVLGDPGSEDVVRSYLDSIIENATHTDGITGEKGLASYSAYTMHSFAEYLAQQAQRDPQFLSHVLAKHPNLRQTYRFHIDTWHRQLYYPNIGDAMGFAEPTKYYAPMFLNEDGHLRPSLYTFLMQLYRATGDVAYVQVLYHANKHSTANLPYDLFAEDIAAFRQEVEAVIAKHGTVIQLKSVNKEKWALGILRSGEGRNSRALWLDYDIGGGHSHADGLNLGLYAKDLDLLPDFGYPQIQYTGTEAQKSGWFLNTASHNTVIVDGKDQGNLWKACARGRTTLWADGSVLHAIRAGFDHHPIPLPHLTSPTTARLALYAYTTGHFRAVKVWTRPNSSAPWTLQFTDDFQRTDLGPDWQITEGEWRIQDGALVGKGKLVCTRNFPGSQRLEYEAWSNEETPCDLSAYLGIAGDNISTFFGFGSNRNAASKIIIRDRIACENKTRITPGQHHHIRCECEEGHAELTIEGATGLVCRHLTSDGLRLVFGNDDGQKQFERTPILVDLSPDDFYVVDIFRVVGGREHTRLFHSYLGTISTNGVNPTPANYEHPGLMKDYQSDSNPQPGWEVEWTVQDYLKLLPPNTRVHLRHIDLTPKAEAWLASSWINVGNFHKKDEHWIPAIMTRRKGEGPLATTFLEIIETHEGQSQIKATRRLPLQTAEGAAYPENYVALEIEFIDGRRDLLIAADPNDALKRQPSLSQNKVMVQPDWNVKTDAELCLIRRNPQGQIIHTAMAKGTQLDCPTLPLKAATTTACMESSH